MSDNSADQKVKHLEELAEKAGVQISPERMQEVRQKLEAEQRDLAKLDEQAQAKLDAPAQENELRSLRRDTAAPEGAADARLRRLGADATAPAGADAASQPAEAPSLQPPAVGERAITERAESGQEKKDKEIYLAENRLSKL
jgi:hypothetical protein